MHRREERPRHCAPVPLANLGGRAAPRLFPSATSFSTTGSWLVLKGAMVTQPGKNGQKSVSTVNLFTGICINKNVPANYWSQNIRYLTLSNLTSSIRKQTHIFVSSHHRKPQQTSIKCNWAAFLCSWQICWRSPKAPKATGQEKYKRAKSSWLSA